MDGQEVIPGNDVSGQAVVAKKAPVPRKRASRPKRRARATKGTPCKSARSIRTLPIREWPEDERPREKLLARGARALSDAELLAVLLRCGTGGLNAIELAQAHIVAFGSLRELLTADRDSWNGKAGVGVARYATLQAALELAKRHLRESLKAGCAITAPETTRRLLLAELQHRPYEIFCCLYLDSHHRLIAFEELFRGTTEIAHVHVKEVVRQTLLHNASAVIFAHNHPSGVMDPSRADEDITRRLRHVLALMEVRVLDHLIVGNGGCYSFAEHGLL
jgi:DNA repair protein RadC